MHIAENLFEEAVSAKSYLQIIEQFRENVDKYNEEMNYSTAFYNVIYNSLVESLFLKLFKLYDRDAKSLTIHSVFNEMKKIDENELDDYVLKKYIENGNKFTHPLNLEEEVYFTEEVNRVKNLCNNAGVKYTHTTIDINLHELVNLYAKRFRTLKKANENLVQRRNKIGAHNDAKTNFGYKKINEEFPLSDNEIDKLVEFAIEFLQFCVEVLTGIHKVPEYLNINDWGKTLNLVRDGRSYRETSKKNNKHDSILHKIVSKFKTLVCRF